MDNLLRQLVDPLEAFARHHSGVPHRDRGAPRHLLRLIRVPKPPGNHRLLEGGHLDRLHPLLPNLPCGPDGVRGVQVIKLFEMMTGLVATPYHVCLRRVGLEPVVLSGLMLEEVKSDLPNRD